MCWRTSHSWSREGSANTCSARLRAADRGAAPREWPSTNPAVHAALILATAWPRAGAPIVLTNESLARWISSESGGEPSGRGSPARLRASCRRAATLSVWAPFFSSFGSVQACCPTSRPSASRRASNQCVSSWTLRARARQVRRRENPHEDGSARCSRMDARHRQYPGSRTRVHRANWVSMTARFCTASSTGSLTRLTCSACFVRSSVASREASSNCSAAARRSSVVRSPQAAGIRPSLEISAMTSARAEITSRLMVSPEAPRSGERAARSCSTRAMTSRTVRRSASIASRRVGAPVRTASPRHGCDARPSNTSA